MAGDDGFVITMEGGGSAGDAGGEQKPAPADLLPIDLHYDKLIDWLVDRKKVPDDWRKRLKALNAKVKAAMSAPPASQAEDGGKEDEEAAAERRKAESILQTVRGDLPDETSVPNGYYLLTSVKDELLESGAGGKKSKGFFSSTTGVAGDLEKILKQYDRDDLSLVETAQFLVKSTDYEIPALSSKLERIYNQIGDTEKKKTEYAKSKATVKDTFGRACAEWDLAVGEVETGNVSALSEKLCRNLADLPRKFDDAIAELRSPEVDDAIKYYKSFVAFVETEVSDNGASSDPLGILAAILAKEREEVPLQAAYQAVLPSALTLAEAAEEEPMMSWDIGDVTPEADSGQAEPTMSWDIGDVTPEAEAAPAEVSWDIGTAGAGADQGGEPDMSWDIGDVTNEGGEEEPTLSWDIGVAEASSGGGGGGSAGAEAKPQGSLLQLEGSVDAAAVDLAERAHKQRLLDDLHELAAFLSQRIAEGEDQSTGFWREPGAVDSKDLVRIVEAAIAKLCSAEVELLEGLRVQTKREKIVRGLKQKQTQEGKYAEMIAGVEKRREDLQREAMILRPKLRALVDFTRRLKGKVEAALSKQYEGRPVNVIGKINETLASTPA